MKNYAFKLRGDCGSTISSLDCLSYNFRSLRNYDGYIIDLSRLKFIHPSGIVGLLCLTERLLGFNKQIRVILPSDSAVSDYFAKIHMLDALNSLTKVESLPVILNNIIPRLTTILPVASFYTEMEVEKIAQQIEKAMHYQGFANLLGPCYNIITELASNVVQHSERSRGWVLAQRYEYQTERIIEIAVGDSGIGIRRSLSKNPHLSNLITDDKSALRKAVSERVSRYSHPLRGNGLYQLCTEILATDRRLTIRSGLGCLVVYDDGHSTAYERSPIVGVLVEARIPC